jgi:hypothetical protein
VINFSEYAVTNSLRKLYTSHFVIGQPGAFKSSVLLHTVVGMQNIRNFTTHHLLVLKRYIRHTNILIHISVGGYTFSVPISSMHDLISEVV